MFNNYFNFINKYFDYEISKKLINNNLYLFLIIILIYILLINLYQFFFLNKINIFKNSINKILTFWNFSLAIFSLFGFIKLTPLIIKSIKEYGIINTYTQITSLQTNQISGYWIYIWVLSKLPELLDTLFIILKNKPIKFMHWFHHSMSILFGTLNFIGDNAYLVWVVWMNYFIHSIMYR
ncbi:Elongation of very long chain fatty acids protein [Meloidogyne graminicola]|uniref:Elongation of very long chain fatty acids protein n=1 Tax=Meloidogyne graminicola TaxID=189291 RepID=A0A8T0A3W8_9BILA|nr:Elongation of very long chain fatty acids protein [Meloidogyne graminicola]